MGTRAYCIQAAEFGLGHAWDKRRQATDFPTDDVFHVMAIATSKPVTELTSRYSASCKEGDRQSFKDDELPSERLADLLLNRNLDGESLSQMTAVPLKMLTAIAEGRNWATTPIIRKIAFVLQLPALRVDTIIWGAHYRKTQHMEFRGSLTKARMHRPTRINQ